MAAQPNPWTAYNDALVARPVRPLATRVLRLTGPGHGRPANDLGCGSGVETRALVAAGWRVTAIDGDPAMPPRLEDLVTSGQVVTVVGDLREVRLPPAKLVLSSLTLPFVPLADFPTLWQRVRASLLPAGWLALDFFGPRDTWSANPSLTFHDRPAIEQLLAGMDIVDVDEDERDGQAYGGQTKHWHIFHVIAQQRHRAL